MALDEALFIRSAREERAVARFYHWEAPAVTAGYFHRSGKAEESRRAPGPTRRFTGGGLVDHGDDLTFLLTFPAGSDAALASVASRYRWIHEALAAALGSEEFPVTLQAAGAASFTGPCFANPVPWDLLDPLTCLKIGGGAQRRSHGAVIHQGSIRLPEPLRDPQAPWINKFLVRIAEVCQALDESTREKAIEESRALEENRYGNPLWNSRT